MKVNSAIKLLLLTSYMRHEDRQTTDTPKVRRLPTTCYFQSVCCEDTGCYCYDCFAKVRPPYLPDTQCLKANTSYIGVWPATEGCAPGQCKGGTYDCGIVS